MYTYVFRVKHLSFGTQLVCSSLGMTTSLSHNFPYLPMFLCVGLGHCGLSSSSLVYPLVSSLFRLHLGGNVGETSMGIALDFTRTYKLTESAQIL